MAAESPGTARTPNGGSRGADEFAEILRPLTGAHLYRDNAFRITGLPTDATPTLIRRRREELTMAERLGTASPVVGELARDPAPTIHELKTAFETLRDPVARVVHEFFWLWGTDGIHDTAVREHCRALERYSAEKFDLVDNEARTREWARALRYWAEALASAHVWDRLRQRVHEIDDPRLTTGTLYRLRDQLYRQIVAVHVELAVEAAQAFGAQAAGRHLRLLNESPLDDQEIADVLRDTVRPVESRVWQVCERARADATAGNGDLAANAQDLLIQLRPALAVIIGLLGDADPVVDSMADRVAETVAGYAALHFDRTSEGDVTMRLLLEAVMVARSDVSQEFILVLIEDISDQILDDLSIEGSSPMAAIAEPPTDWAESRRPAPAPIDRTEISEPMFLGIDWTEISEPTPVLPADSPPEVHWPRRWPYFVLLALAAYPMKPYESLGQAGLYLLVLLGFGVVWFIHLCVKNRHLADRNPGPWGS